MRLKTTAVLALLLSASSLAPAAAEDCLPKVLAQGAARPVAHARSVHHVHRTTSIKRMRPKRVRRARAAHVPVRAASHPAGPAARKAHETRPVSCDVHHVTLQSTLPKPVTPAQFLLDEIAGQPAPPAPTVTSALLDETPIVPTGELNDESGPWSIVRSNNGSGGGIGAPGGGGSGGQPGGPGGTQPVNPPGGSTPPSDQPPTNILPPDVPPAAVPEPDTWVILIVGFLGLGRALRSRRSRTNPA